jgi:hypothetical protein
LILGLYLAGKIVHEIGVFVVDVWIIGKYLKFTFPIDESAVLYLQNFGEHKAILLAVGVHKSSDVRPPNIQGN